MPPLRYSAPTSSGRRTWGRSSFRLPSWRQALQIQLGHAAAHEVGDDAGGTAGHGPAHVPVPAVEEEVAVAAEAKDGRPIGGHGPETRAILAPIEVDCVGEDVAGEAKDVVEVARGPAPVVAGELRRRGETEPVAEA